MRVNGVYGTDINTFLQFFFRIAFLAPGKRGRGHSSRNKLSESAPCAYSNASLPINTISTFILKIFPTV